MKNIFDKKTLERVYNFRLSESFVEDVVPIIEDFKDKKIIELGKNENKLHFHLNFWEGLSKKLISKTMYDKKLFIKKFRFISESELISLIQTLDSRLSYKHVKNQGKIYGTSYEVSKFFSEEEYIYDASYEVAKFFSEEEYISKQYAPIPIITFEKIW